MNSPSAADIEAAKTERGGWTKSQLAEWGISWPPPPGWKQRLLGTWREIGDFVPAILGRCACTALIKGCCESPIEIIFGAAVLFLHPEVQLRDKSQERDISRPLLVPQYVWLRYRMDFALFAAGSHEPSVFVECDGREFHSTDEQIKRDRAKDSAAATAGITLMRFSGAEIHRHYDACARLAMAALARAV